MPNLGIDARRPLGTRQVGEIARWRPREEDLGTTTARTEAIRLAKRILALDSEIADNMIRIGELVDASPAAGLAEETGIGPVTSATVLVAWSHPGRVRDEAAFAALAGVSPIPASSGNTTRHRLNRGGDRRLNRALNVIAMVRMVHHPQTRAYADRRRTEGKTDREIRRCLKRYLARRLYRHLNHAAAAKTGVDGT
ncbi:transposase [Streptomyces sp. NPDC048419]|uniref:transposase n=1 Tax=Streptomyces sp. NPDC048419 TaxID=3365547 RepID=UPI00372344D0